MTLPQDTETVVNDAGGRRIVVGSRVRSLDGTPADAALQGVVTAISDPDADYDDNLERAVMYPPRVSVTFDDGSEEKFTTYADWRSVSMYDEPDFITDDLEAA